jgi:hypothetical protein
MTLEEVVIGAILGGALTLIASLIVTKISLKAAEKKFRIQLVYNDRKSALSEMYLILKKEHSSYPQFKKEI